MQPIALAINVDTTWDFGRLSRIHGLDLFPLRDTLRIWDVRNLIGQRHGEVRQTKKMDIYWSYWPSSIISPDRALSTATTLDLCADQLETLVQMAGGQRRVYVALVTPPECLEPANAENSDMVGTAAFFQRLRRRLNRQVLHGIRFVAVIRRTPRTWVDDGGAEGFSAVFNIQKRRDDIAVGDDEDYRREFLRFKALLSYLSFDEDTGWMNAAPGHGGRRPHFHIAFADDHTMDVAGSWGGALSGVLEERWNRLTSETGEGEVDDSLTRARQEMERTAASVVEDLSEPGVRIPTNPDAFAGLANQLRAIIRRGGERRRLEATLEAAAREAADSFEAEVTSAFEEFRNRETAKEEVIEDVEDRYGGLSVANIGAGTEREKRLRDTLGEVTKAVREKAEAQFARRSAIGADYDYAAWRQAPFAHLIDRGVALSAATRGMRGGVAVWTVVVVGLLLTLLAAGHVAYQAKSTDAWPEVTLMVSVYGALTFGAFGWFHYWRRRALLRDLFTEISVLEKAFHEEWRAIRQDAVQHFSYLAEAKAQPLLTGFADRLEEIYQQGERFKQFRVELGTLLQATSAHVQESQLEALKERALNRSSGAWRDWSFEQWVGRTLDDIWDPDAIPFSLEVQVDATIVAAKPVHWLNADARLLIVSHAPETDR